MLLNQFNFTSTTNHECCKYNCNNIRQSVNAVGAWPICMSESDQQRRYPGWSPSTMGSWVLTPRASVSTTAGRMKWRGLKQVSSPVLLEQKSKGQLMCHLFYFVCAAWKDKAVVALPQKWIWTSCHSDLENARWTRQRYKSITACAKSVIVYTRSPQTTSVLLPLYYIS